jgi:hypothetical protein
MNARQIAMIVTPLAAMAALAAAMHVGASSATRAAIVSGAPRAKGSDALVWQIAVYADDGGIREALVVPDLAVVARHGRGAARFEGATNADGVAEARLAFASGEAPGPGDDLWIEVQGLGEVLASGRAAWGPGWSIAPHAAWARATRREGAILLDVAPLGGRVPAGFPGSLFVRATDAATGALLAGVGLDVEPEPGLEVPGSHVVTCASGWAEIVATPTFHVAGMSIHATKGARDGLWFGGIPVAGGASHVAAPLRIDPGAARRIDVTAAGPRGEIYTEIDDSTGRAAAQILGAPRGAIDLPPLAEGMYWIVTSNEARGAESLEGAAIARPVLVQKERRDPCDSGALLAASAATPFVRWTALDGFGDRRRAASGRRRLGLAIGLSALAIAGLLEALLVLGSARRGAELAPSLVKKSPAGGVAIAILACLLGFALIAALLLYRGG